MARILSLGMTPLNKTAHILLLTAVLLSHLVATDEPPSTMADEAATSERATAATVAEDARLPVAIDAHPAMATRRFTAFAQPWRQLTLSSEIGGRITAVHRDVGQVTTDASPVLEIDVSRLDASAARLDATLAVIEAGKVILEQDIALSERRLAFHQREYDRNKALAENGAVSATRLDQLTLTRDEAQMTVNRQKLREAELIAQQAQVAADRQDIEWQRNRARVIAPAGWTVRQRLVHPGTAIQPGTPLLTLADNRIIRLSFFLNDQELLNLKNGQGTLRSKHTSATSVPATLAWVDPQPDPVTGKKQVFCDLEIAQLPAALQDTSTWELLLKLDDPDGGLVLSKDYLLQRFDQWYVQTTTGALQAVVILAHNTSNNTAIIAPPPLPAGTLVQVPR